MAFGKKPPQGGGDFGNERNSEDNWVDDFEDGECVVINDEVGDCLEFAKSCMQFGIATLEGKVRISRNLDSLVISVTWSGDSVCSQECGAYHKDVTEAITIPGKAKYGTGSLGATVLEFTTVLVAIKRCSGCIMENGPECPTESWVTNVNGSHRFTIRLTDEIKKFIKKFEKTVFNPHLLLNPVSMGLFGTAFTAVNNPEVQKEMPKELREALQEAYEAIQANMEADLNLCGD